MDAIDQLEASGSGLDLVELIVVVLLLGVRSVTAHARVAGNRVGQYTGWDWKGADEDAPRRSSRS